jgi:phospholipase A1
VLGKLSRIEFGYTNRSFWQAYNSAISKPFRETNHEPELMVTWQMKNYWLDYVGLSLNHQSNGQSSTLSRSWNRIIGEAAVLVPNAVVHVRAWWRISEKNSADPEDPSDDDNPDIEKYLGYGELTYLHVMKHHQFSATMRNNLDWNENRGSLELGWSFPMTSKTKGYIQYFNGYGESLIDYNRYQERFGIGIKLSDWF